MAEGGQVRSSKPKEQRKAKQAGTAIIWTSEITSAASIALGDEANENDGAAASRQPTDPVWMDVLAGGYTSISGILGYKSHSHISAGLKLGAGGVYAELVVKSKSQCTSQCRLHDKEAYLRMRKEMRLQGMPEYLRGTSSRGANHPTRPRSKFQRQQADNYCRGASVILPSPPRERKALCQTGKHWRLPGFVQVCLKTLRIKDLCKLAASSSS
ncbi:hypothetical protein RRG08_041715 [Elysia crispata]|uniref:Uncharacterized protein n=1 Tax=Elysia crispata TaxID=231223 RepID=A0AAE0YZZ6_9GAST|nr:hypothetical protein RRG08_041715 [Elysia crispata]